MDEIKLPAIITKTEQTEKDGQMVDVVTEQSVEVTAKLVEQRSTEKDILIKSLPYLPDFLQDKAVMKDASIILDALLLGKEQLQKELQDLQEQYNQQGYGQTVNPVDWDVMDTIYTAYCDTLYKLPGYSNLSYEARIALIKENGFDYVLDLLLHIYDDEYNKLAEKYKEGAIPEIPTYEDFVKERTDDTVTKLTILFTLINVLKGTTAGLETVFKILGITSYFYITWDVVADYKGYIEKGTGDNIIPSSISSNLVTGNEEPNWGDNTFVVDNNIIWEKTEDGEPTVEWQPNLKITDKDIVHTDNGNYKVYKPKKGDVFSISDGDSDVPYMYNGVSWHLCPNWSSYTTQREPFTAELNITGISDNASLQTKVNSFVRYYMLPYIAVTLEFTADFPMIYSYFSGWGILQSSSVFDNYLDENGEVVHKDVTVDVSQAGWHEYTTNLSDLTLGKPTFKDRGFQGIFDLAKSFVRDPDGTKHYLYGDFQIIPDIITGPARDRYTPEDTIEGYLGDDDYLEAPLVTDGYIDIDIVTGDQMNPTFQMDSEGNYSVLERDTLVRIFSALTVGGIHEQKTIEEMNQLKLAEFMEQLTEVYAGRVTNVHAEGVFYFQTRPHEVSDKVGIEGPYHLIFSDYELEEGKYHGIGDIGILGANTYFIYNGMLLGCSESGHEYIDPEDGWTDIGASHAVSDKYWTPGIKDEKLYYINKNTVYDSTESEITWTNITGYINEFFTAFGIANNKLYKIYFNETKPEYEILDDNTGWTYLTGMYYYDTYKAYGIKNGVMYTIGDTIEPLLYNGTPLTGWDSSFDCISRYHHSNLHFITYGICGGKLYAINGNTLTLIDDTGTWTATCGYYNDESPRTFGYAIKDGALYELQGNDVVLKEDTHYWIDISGSTTTTKTYILGIGKNAEADEGGYLFAINAKEIIQLKEDGGYTDVFGRYTTSTSLNNNCYGYAIKNNKLYLMHLDVENPVCVSGNWKLDGVGKPVDLNDYYITDISIVINEQLYEGQEEVIKHIPVGDEDPHIYDITVSYETVGFENNTRYNIRTENVAYTESYPNPEGTREGVVTHTQYGEWNPTTGISNPFIICPVYIHGNRKINGQGEAYDFVQEKTYLELPKMGYYTFEFNYDNKHYGPLRFDKTKHNMQFVQDNDLLYDIEKDKPQINSYIRRLLDNYEANTDREIEYLLTIRDELSITIHGEEFDDNPEQIIIRFGCVGNEGELQPIILDELGISGIFFGNSGIFVRDINGLDTKFIELPNDIHKEPTVKFIKNGDYFNIQYTETGDTYTPIDNIQVSQPLYLGGNEQSQGDCIIFLADSSMVGTNETIKLYDYNYYIEVDTLGQNLIEKLHTGINQEDQKVIEVLDKEKNLLLELRMDELYTSRVCECTNPELKLTDTYTLNTLNQELFEGTTVATLTYSGQYQIDSEKAIEYGNIGDYATSRQANQFSDTNYLTLNNMIEDPLVIVTGDEVGEQYLFDTEEDYVTSNKKLLLSEITGEYIGSNMQMRLVNSGEEFELLTDTDQVVTRTLEYNAPSFEIDTDKIKYTENYAFDPYTALLQFYPTITGVRETSSCMLPFQGIPTESGETWVLPKLCFNYDGENQRKLIEVDDTAVLLGNKKENIIYEDTWYTQTELEGELTEIEEPLPTYDEASDTWTYEDTPLELTALEDPDYEIGTGMYPLHKHEFKKQGQVGEYPKYILYRQLAPEWVDDPDAPFEYKDGLSEYWLQIKINKTYVGLDEERITAIDPNTEPKDKLMYEEGKVHNFSDTNYFEIGSLAGKKGLILSLIINDDPSINQGILEVPGVGSLCIRDSHLCWIDTKLWDSGVDVKPNETIYIAFRNLAEEDDPDALEQPEIPDWNRQENLNDLTDCEIYISRNDIEWSRLFGKAGEHGPYSPIDLTRADKSILGYANVTEEKMPFLGEIDLCNSYVDELEEDGITNYRFFNVMQETSFYISEEENGEYTLVGSVTSYNSINEFYFGFNFTGTLDMYKSKLLREYGLGWVDNKVLINDKVRQDIIDAGQTPEDREYTLEDYGVQLEKKTPERFDRIELTYTTTDHAYYMKPNTKYYIKLNTEIDNESGYSILENNGTASWENGVVKDFTTEDRYLLDVTDVEFFVVQFKTSSIKPLQAIIGYEEDNSKSILIEDKKVKYFDDTNTQDLGLSVVTNKNYWIKLYTTEQPIEYSLDGETWIKSDVSVAFNNYLKLTVGNGYTTEGRLPFQGSIDLKKSYLIKADGIDYIYTPYKKVYPTISEDGVEYYPLYLTPLLTIQDFITFGKGFDQTLDLYESNLLRNDTVFWTGKEITIYEGDEEIDKIVRDKINVTEDYWTDERITQIFPDDLKLHVEGLPEIGDQITITYDTWYLFRKDDTTYEFKITHDDQYCYISFNEEGSDKEYLIYTMSYDRYIVRTGFQFHGRFLVKDSTRDGLSLCPYYKYNTWEINYKKHDDEEWTLWTTFVTMQDVTLMERCGFDLKGTHYLNSSWLKVEDYETPFITHYNYYYVIPYGSVNIENDGTANTFSDKSYLKLIPEMLKDGCMVEIQLTTAEDVDDQGVATNVLINRKNFNYSDRTSDKYTKSLPTTDYVIQYLIKDGKVVTRMVRMYFTNYEEIDADASVLNCIPYNLNVPEDDDYRFIKTQEQANRIKVYYRITGPNDTIKDWSIIKHTGTASWFEAQMTHADLLEKPGKKYEDLYVAPIPCGYTEEGVNTNPKNMDYNRGQIIQVRLVSTDENGAVFNSYFKVVPYVDMLFEQKVKV